MYGARVQTSRLGGERRRWVGRWGSREDWREDEQRWNCNLLVSSCFRFVFILDFSRRGNEGRGDIRQTDRQG